MESIKRENERILRAQEELNKILTERFQTEGRGKRADSEDISHQHKYKKIQKKIKMKVAHIQMYLVINVIFIPLVIVVMKIIILKRENINSVRKIIESLKILNHQHSMERLRRGRKRNPGYLG